ncbi:hypothetical protein [Streptomyces sp. NPDC054834]
MTTRLDLPHPERVRKAADELMTQAARNGTRPSVLGLAQRVGLSNTTLRRHFPEIVEAIGAVRSGTAPEPAQVAGTKRYQDLVRRNAKIRRANRELTDQLALALACIQRLSVENARLVAAVEASANVRRINVMPRGTAAGSIPGPPQR